MANDFPKVTLKWAGTFSDGTAVTGYLSLSYDGGAMLDQGVMPVSVFPSKVTAQITSQTKEVPLDADPTVMVSRTVGYAELVVPASNNPDTPGSGGTYTVSEVLNGGGGRTFSFVADKDAPGGVLWLNQLAGTDPDPGEPISAIYRTEFDALEDRVEALEAGGGTGVGGDGTVVDATTTVKGVLRLSGDLGGTALNPTVPGLAGKANATHAHAQTDVTGLASALAGKAPTSHGHVTADVSGLDTALAGKAPTSHAHTTTDVTGLETALAGKAPTTHAHAQADVTGLSTALAGKAASVHTHGVADLTATGTRDATVFLRGDGTWAQPPAGGEGGGVSDHGSLTGLADDDHPQYALADGSRGSFAATSHAHPTSEVTGLDAALSGKAATAHTHTTSQVTGLDTALAGKAATSHTHTTSQVTGLDTALAGKVDTGDARLTDARTPLAHAHATSDVTGLDTALADKVDTDDPRLTDARTPTAHTHTASQVSDSTATGRALLTAADAAAARTAIGAGTSNLALGTTASTAKAGNYAPTWTEVTSKPSTFAPSAHSHATSEVTGLDTALSGKAASSHTHATSEVTGLDTALAGKAASSHTHAAADVSDSTTVGRQVLTAANAAAARTAIGAGTSSLALGTTSATAKAGDYVPTYAEVTGKPATFAPSAHSHAVADTTGLQTALDARPVWMTVVNPATDARPAGATHVMWVGGTTQPTNMTAGDLWIKEI